MIKSFKLVLSFGLTSLLSAENELDYYKIHFQQKPKHPLADTLFEKTVWHRKVSHLVLEERAKKYRVTLLMITPYPHNYKSENYPLYYEFHSRKQARLKFEQLDSLLRENGVLRVHIKGSLIVKEETLYKP